MTTMQTSGSDSNRNISYGTSIHNYHQDSPKTVTRGHRGRIIARSAHQMLLAEIVLMSTSIFVWKLESMSKASMERWLPDNGNIRYLRKAPPTLAELSLHRAALREASGYVSDNSV